MVGNEAASNGGSGDVGPFIMHLEMEMERDSLIAETEGEFNGFLTKLTHRKRLRRNGLDGFDEFNDSTTAPSRFRGLLRSPTAFRVRNAILVACLGWLVLLFIGKMNAAMNRLDEVEIDPRAHNIHTSSFGGLHNTGHPAGSKAHQNHDVDDFSRHYIVGQSVLSLSEENLMNHNGHYWHDPEHCPFASHLYNRTVQEIQQEQWECDMKRNRTVAKYGAWTFVDSYYETHHQLYRPQTNFISTKNKDLFYQDFPPEAWQLEKEYVAKFIDQGKNLISRVKQGIYEEYGHEQGNDLDAFQVILDDFKVQNGVAVNMNGKFKPGVAYLQRNAWDALIQKLLHSIITQDVFYVVVAGDASVAGHGNNFFQSTLMQFHYLMEPIFDLLGMTLVSRNMAMQNVPTTYSALGGADIYGEADIMWFAGPPDHAGSMDLFHKQAILSGERVPILLTPAPGNLDKDTDGAAWIGNIQPGNTMCPAATLQNVDSIPPACTFVNCDKSNSWCQEQYDSVCWVDRIDFKPPVQQAVSIDNPKKHPGYLHHRLEARKLSLLLLHALDEAFDTWVDGIKEDGFPLDEAFWHVSNVYDEVRDSVRTNSQDDLTITKSACEQTFAAFPIVCHVEMHAFTEWTPRVTPERSSLSQILYPKMNSMNFEVESLYVDIDVLPLQWKIPPDQVDVHAIAISSSLEPEKENEFEEMYDDDSFYGNDDFSWFNQNDDLGHMDDAVRQEGDGGNRRRTSTVEELEASYVDADENARMFDPSSRKQEASPKATPPPTKAPPLPPTAKAAPPPTKSPSPPPPTETASPPTTNSPPPSPTEKATPPRTKSTPAPPVPAAKTAATTDDTIKPGLGWTVQNPIPGFCDGSAQSTCNRSPTSKCLLAGHNDFQSGVLGDALSGWLMLRVINVKEGVILARLDIDVQGASDPVTEGWTAIDQGNGSRQLHIPADFEFDYAINGKVTTLSRAEFLDFGVKAGGISTLFPFLMDTSISEKERDAEDEGETIDVAIRIRSDLGRAATVLLSHLYYA